MLRNQERLDVFVRNEFGEVVYLVDNALLDFDLREKGFCRFPCSNNYTCCTTVLLPVLPPGRFQEQFTPSL
jgi:hypothetical protein